jgi:hypothetical protein
MKKLGLTRVSDWPDGLPEFGLVNYKPKFYPFKTQPKPQVRDNLSD